MASFGPITEVVSWDRPIALPHRGTEYLHNPTAAEPQFVLTSAVKTAEAQELVIRATYDSVASASSAAQALLDAVGTLISLTTPLSETYTAALLSAHPRIYHTVQPDVVVLEAAVTFVLQAQ